MSSLVGPEELLAERWELGHLHARVQRERVGSRESAFEALPIRRPRHCPHKVGSDVKTEGAERRVAAHVAAGVQGQLVDSPCVDALDLVVGNSVEDDLQPEVLHDCLGLDEVAAVAECQREKSARRLDQQHGGGRRVVQALEVFGDVGAQQRGPPGNRADRRLDEEVVVFGAEASDEVRLRVSRRRMTASRSSSFLVRKTVRRCCRGLRGVG